MKLPYVPTRPGERSLYLAELLDDKCFGNSKGDFIRIYEEDEDCFYYYDGFDRWCYAEKESFRIIKTYKRKENKNG